MATLPIEERAGEWHLKTAERKRILLNNIYGVDIDTQAVEVTKLSLLLKVLEGENKATITDLNMYSDERALPDLGNNIKCGNSLIGWDILEDRPDLSQEELERINPFMWEDEFKEVFAKGGFDAVIGNPPYVNVTILGSDIKAILSKRFSAATRRFDLYVPFTEKSINLLLNGGLLGFIMPSMFMRREYGKDLRKTILEKSAIERIVDFGTYQVFDGPLNYVNIFIIKKNTSQKAVFTLKIDRKVSENEVKAALAGGKNDRIKEFLVPGDAFSKSSEWYLYNTDKKNIIDRLFNNYPPIETVLSYASEGIHSGKDEVFFIKSSTAEDLNLETPPVYPLVKGKDVHRYEHIDTKSLKQKVIYPYDLEIGRVYNPDTVEIIAPNVWSYLLSSKDLLKGRGYFDKSNKKWYELWCPRNPELFTSKRLVVPEITNRGNYTIIEDKIFTNTKVKSIIPKKDLEEKIEYILGLLNSKLLVNIYKSIAPPKSGDFFAVKTRLVGRLPFRRIDFSDPQDVARHDKMVSLVETMLDLHKQLHEVGTPHEKTRIQNQIDYTDKQIDALVYELYDLTEEEIAIVEESAK